ncbi:MAG: hypothetical protein V8Q84_04060 [Bilophila sp.]
MTCLKRCGKAVVAGLMMVALAVPALAAEVSTKYFTIDLPDGWTQPQPVQEANGAVMAIFQNTKDGSAVTLTIAPAPMSAKDVAEQTVANMKQGGLEASAPVKKDGIYETTFAQGPGKGVSYFGSNGKEFAVTTILGSTTETGKEFLKNLKPKDDKLFPRF